LNNSYPQYIFYNVLIGLVLSLVMGWVAILFARRAGPMDIPGILPHKKHAAPTPLAGGMALVLTLLVGGLVFNFSMARELWNILLPALIIFAVGLWDDFKRLPPWIKLAGQVVAGILLIVLGTSVHIIPGGLLGLPANFSRILDWLITLFWVIGITNAFNLTDSMDGLILGISGLGLSFLILTMLNSPQVTLLQLITLLLGTCIGLYFYNHTPAKLFLGDSGAQTLGFLLATVSILFTPFGHMQASSWFLPILVLGVPIFDVTLVIFSRLRRHIPIYRGGLDHTYHRLVGLGFDSKRAVIAMHLAAIVLGCVAFIALDLNPIVANTLFVLVCLTGFAVIIFLDRVIKK
jgi:UDP-GlcNAc:undecaprenyl-phosphate GlcNAc-1-phosphate transferase